MIDFTEKVIKLNARKMPTPGFFVISTKCSKFIISLIFPGILEWPEGESNPRHKDFQSFALPTELSGLQYFC